MNNTSKFNCHRELLVRLQTNFSELREQSRSIGVNLVPRKAPVEVVVIDRWESSGVAA
jgi:hypothetical protein